MSKDMKNNWCHFSCTLLETQKYGSILTLLFSAPSVQQCTVKMSFNNYVQELTNFDKTSRAAATDIYTSSTVWFVRSNKGFFLFRPDSFIIDLTLFTCNSQEIKSRSAPARVDLTSDLTPQWIRCPYSYLQSLTWAVKLLFLLLFPMPSP